MAHFGRDLDNFSAARTVQITNTETNEHFTTYTIQVTVGHYTWTVKHRYSEFHDLHEKLVVGYKLDKSLLPPKKLFGNQTEAFIRKRQQDLQVYLQTVLHYLAHHPPPALTFFLHFHLYEIHGITQAMAEDLYNRGEMILQSKEVYQVTPLQLYSLTERLKLPEPTCDSGDVKKDLGHILDFITRTKHLQICGNKSSVGESNIHMNKLKFDLGLFKSLQSLEVLSCNFQMLHGLETIKQTLMSFNVYQTADTIKELVLQEVPRWKGEDGTQLVAGWDHVTHVDFSHNSIQDIDDSVQILWRAEHVNLSHNLLETVQHLQWLSHMTHLDLSHNRLRVLDALHTKLGNLKCLLLSENRIESLHGFSKLFSLEILDVSHNKISKVENVRAVCQLPCLEKLDVSGNAVTLTLDYRTKLLEMFGERVEEVSLDSQKASQQERDTVAVRLALNKARQSKPRHAAPRKNSSSASVGEEGGGSVGTPPLPPLVHQAQSPAQGSSSVNQQQGGGNRQMSSSVPYNPTSFSPLRTHSDLKDGAGPSPSGIFVPGLASPGRGSLSSCASAHEMSCEAAEEATPIPEAHPFDPLSEALPPATAARKVYNLPDLPTMSSLDFIAWLEQRLLNDESSTYPTILPPTHDPGGSSNMPCDQVMDVMWCYGQQYSAPGSVFPCCVVLTSTKIIVERLRERGNSQGFPGIPELSPCVILPLGSLQQVVVGPCHAYLRLEEAFVGKGGLFSLFAVDFDVLKHFANSLNECCRHLDESSPVDVLDLSLQSDLLSEVCRREESLGLPSDRLAFVMMVRMRDGGQMLLVLSENIVYCLDMACVYWPPPTFQSTHEGAIHLKVQRELSIMDDIVDMSLHTDTQAAAQSSVDFSLIPLTMQFKKAERQGELVFLFSAGAARDTFLARLTNLRTEHAHRMSPSVREAPEGGNESVDIVDSSVLLSAQSGRGDDSHGLRKEQPVQNDSQTQLKDSVRGDDNQDSRKGLHLKDAMRSDESQGLRKGLPLQDTNLTQLKDSVSGNNNPGSRAGLSILNDSQIDSDDICEDGLTEVQGVAGDGVPPSDNKAVPVPPKVSITHPGSSLPSSFDWKGYYFRDTSTHPPPDPGSSQTEATEGGQGEVPKDPPADPSSGEVEETEPTPLEQELRQGVRTYDLLQPMPARLRPVSLMSGREVLTFFYSKIARPSPSSSPSSETGVKSMTSPATGVEELRHVMWTNVVPYSDPSKEVVTLVMLSTRAVYLVSDSSGSTPASTRPSWMTHNRHKSDSAVSWHSKSPSPQGGNHAGRWSKVKAYAVLPLAELVQVSMGLFDQFLRLTGPSAPAVYTLATRSSAHTAVFVDNLKTSLSLMVSSPMADRSPTDIEQDFYRAFYKRTQSTVEGLVYTHPSKVNFIYPGDDAIDDILFLIKAKIQASSMKENSGKAVVGDQRKEAMWLYILAYQLLPPFTETLAAVPPERVQPRSIIVTSRHLCLAREDTVTYPLPDFVRGLPEQPQHEVMETRCLESLKRILLSTSNPHILTLVFWDEPDELVVDTDMEHFGQEEGVVVGEGGRKGGRKVAPDVVIKLYVQCQRDSDKLVKTVEKQWRELVPQVGRILDVVRE